MIARIASSRPMSSPSQRRRASRTVIALAGAASLSLLLLGCTAEPDPGLPSSSASSPAPSASPSSSGLPAPETADEATDAASDAVDRFIELINQISADGGADAERMNEVAGGEALAAQLTSAKSLADSGATVSGDSVFEFQGSYTVPSAGDNPLQFGSVVVDGCFDTSGRTVTQADGTEALQPPEQRTPRELTVVFDQATGRWLVQSFISQEGTC